MTNKPNEINNPRSNYAACLLRGLANALITPDAYTELGRELAAAQAPPRAIPYYDFTIAGWAKGELLPTPQAQCALVSVLDAEYGVPNEALETLDDLHDTALDWQATQRLQPMELNHAMRHAIMLSGKSQGSIARVFVKKNKIWAAARPENAGANTIASLLESPAALSFTLNGKKGVNPSKFVTYSIEQLCKPPFSLRAIHENALRERGDALWAMATRDYDLGGLIKACRVRLGESMESFSTRVGSIAGLEDFGSSNTAFYWENNISLPKGSHNKGGKTLYEPIVQAMNIADTAKNGLSLAIQAPWFDAAKENVFCQAFSHAVKSANEGNFISELPSQLTTRYPDPKNVKAYFRVYEGQLHNRLIGGTSRE